MILLLFTGASLNFLTPRARGKINIFLTLHPRPKARAEPATGPLPPPARHLHRLRLAGRLLPYIAICTSPSGRGAAKGGRRQVAMGRRRRRTEAAPEVYLLFLLLLLLLTLSRGSTVVRCSIGPVCAVCAFVCAEANAQRRRRAPGYLSQLARGDC